MGTAILWSKLSGEKGGRKALNKFQIEQNKLINGRKWHGCLSWLCMGEEPKGASLTSHPCISRSAGGTGQLLWLLHRRRAVPLLRAGLWRNSKGWEGRPQDLLPHLTVFCSHTAPGILASSAGGVRYEVAFPRFTGRGEVT